MKEFRINVRANKEMKINLESLKSLISLRTEKKYSDSEVLRIVLEYCMMNNNEFIKYFEEKERLE